MATIQSIKSKIQGLIDKSNEATGGNDTDLTSAVDSLIANQGGSGDEDEYNVEWLNDVVFWDYDGTMVARYSIEEANALTELPTPPSHDGLTFQSWNHTLEEINSIDHILDVGATYIPSDGKTHVKVRFTNTATAYKKYTIRFMQTVDRGVTINWGDGTVETYSGVDTSISAVHNYANIGEYEITFDVSDGCVMTLGDGTAYFLSTALTSAVREVYVGKNTKLTDKTFQSYSIQYLTLPNGITEIPSYCLYTVSNLRSLILPRGVTKTYDYGTALGGVYVSNGTFERVVSFPLTVTEIGNFGPGWDNFQKRCILPDSLESLPKYAFSNSAWALVHYYNSDIEALVERMFYTNGSLKKYTCAQGLTEIPPYAFVNTYGLEEFTANDELKTIGNGNLYNAPRLKKISLNEGLETIGTNFLYQTNVKDVIIPSTVTLIDDGFLQASTVERLVIKGADTTINKTNYFLKDTHRLKEIFLLSPTPPPCTANIVGSSLNGTRNTTVKVYVNDDSYEAYKSVSTSTVYVRILPLSEYKGKIFWE